MSVSSRLLLSLSLRPLFTVLLEVVLLMVWPLVRWTFLTPTALMLMASGTSHRRAIALVYPRERLFEEYEDSWGSRVGRQGCGCTLELSQE
jgi:hypothetical protein